jgi:hypothetical protein
VTIDDLRGALERLPSGASLGLVAVGLRPCRRAGRTPHVPALRALLSACRRTLCDSQEGRAVTTQTKTRAITWRCPACRCRGAIENAGADVQARILDAHATKQPRCEGTAVEVRE